jgi:hypothetical protein
VERFSFVTLTLENIKLFILGRPLRYVSAVGKHLNVLVTLKYMEESTLGRNPMYVRNVEGPSFVFVPLRDIGRLTLEVIPKYRMCKGLFIA